MKISKIPQIHHFHTFSEDHQPFDSLCMPWAFLSKCFAYMTYLSISLVALSDIWSRSGYMFSESKLLWDSHINHNPLLGPYMYVRSYIALQTIYEIQGYTSLPNFCAYSFMDSAYFHIQTSLDLESIY